jgi:hypothetical protein
MLTAAGQPGTVGALAGPTLIACLRLAVPPWLDAARQMPPEELARMAADAAEALAGGGVKVLAGMAAGDLVPVISDLARLIAITAVLQPGGVMFCGQHWCAAAHPGCPDLQPHPSNT